MQHRRRQRQNGFTLLESLVALVLAGIITAGVALALRTGLDASARIQERADSHAEARAVLEELRADLTAAYLSGANTQRTQFVALPPESAAAGEPFLSFSTLSYRSSHGPGARPPRQDAVLVEYRLEAPPRPAAEEDGRQVLIRRETWPTERGEGRRDVVCDRVAGLRLRYFDGTEFQEGWSADPEADPPLTVEEGESYPEPSARELPRAVEITLLLHSSGTADAPRPPRTYRTVVSLGAQAALPFETEVIPPPEPAGETPQPGPVVPPGGENGE
ncbi:MAG: type II secretion system protein GspJ [Armatimonadota bacterium]